MLGTASYRHHDEMRFRVAANKSLGSFMRLVAAHAELCFGVLHAGADVPACSALPVLSQVYTHA
jgi:hypothetical protein